MKRLLLLFFGIIFFTSCNTGSVPKDILDKDEMINVLTDVHLADGYASVVYADSSRNEIAAMYQAIYKKYNTDSIGIRKSLEFYSKDPAELKIMYETINARLAKLDKEEQDLATQKQMQIQDSIIQERRKEELKEKLKRDSLRNDSLNKQYIKIDTFNIVPLKRYVLPKMLKRDSVKIDSLKKDSIRNLKLNKAAKPLKIK